ncbi:Arrestin domain-containing protein 3 [Mizuhopecten yessoensis]|uniref:Arrestin domain-containing protein 3 n=1 Tax=Mizuhopecten yessoensis TaxID=6573 RepID=A0A210QHI1_MIZYE|nr:Arrestin domain-containing protein 3 [Mizuhopecten yessoensis]
MGKIGDITVTIDGGKEVYRSGEAVKGVWRVHVNERVTVNDISISLNGESYVKWTETNSDARAPDLKFISREHYTNQKKYVVYDKTTLEAGVYEYPFNYPLPTDKMPSSFEGKRGCSRYWLFLKISRPLPWRDVISDKCITFIDDVNINMQYYSKPVTRKKSTRLSKLLGFGDAGEVTLTAKIPRTGFCAGEAIPVTVVAVNASRKDLGKLKVSLVQSVDYNANGDAKTEKTFICTKTGSDPIGQGQTRSWKNELLYIDAVPPSTRMRASFCLVVSYMIKVYIDIPLLSGGDLVLWLPITIGTVPQGYKKSIPATGATGAAPNIPVTDLSNALTYTRCNRGWEKFIRSTNNAIPEYVSYTPMCVYVPNYTYRPKPLVASPPKQGTPKTSATGKVKATQVSTASSKSATSPPSTSESSSGQAVTTAKSQTSVSTAVTAKSTVSATQVSKSTTGVQTSVPTSGQTKSAASAVQTSSSPAQGQTSIPTFGPSKSTATVAQPSNSLAEGQGRKVPSAPPVYCFEGDDEDINMGDLAASLPSYEELFGQGAAEAKIEVEDTSTGKVFMVIKFQATRRQEFIDTLKKYSSGLEKFQGTLSALQHQVHSAFSGKWAKTSRLAVLTFESADMAKDWFKCTPEVCMEKWLGGCDILLVEASEPFQEDHQVLTLSNRVPAVEDTGENEDLARYRYLMTEYMKPSSVRLGVASVANTKVNSCLRGHWDMNIDQSVIIHSWPTMDVVKQYKSSVDPEIYQEVAELRKKVFDTVLSLMIKLGPLPSLTNSQEKEAGEEEAGKEAAP